MNQIIQYNLWFRGRRVKKTAKQQRGTIHFSKNKLHITRMKRRRLWHPTPALLPGESHGRRSLVGCSPWGRTELDTTERLHFHFSLVCIGEGNGNPLQCSCLENPREGGAWWAAVYGVARSRTRLKRLSSSSSSRKRLIKAICHQLLETLEMCLSFHTRLPFLGIYLKDIVR